MKLTQKVYFRENPMTLLQTYPDCKQKIKQNQSGFAFSVKSFHIADGFFFLCTFNTSFSLKSHFTISLNSV